MSSFRSSAVFQQLQQGLTPDLAKKVNAVFQFDVKNSSGSVQSWTLDLKSNPPSVKSPASGKADITIAVSDDDFVDLASGKLNGQKAFMAGKLKVKGNMMLATKLDGVLKQATSAAPAKSASTKSSGGDSVAVAGFNSSQTLQQLKAGVQGMGEADRKATVKKVNAVFQFDIKNSGGKVQSWTLDLKNGLGELTVGAAKTKADIIIAVSDADFTDLANGKTTGQKAFMQGKVKVKGNMMLATKLDGVLKMAKGKSNL